MVLKGSEKIARTNPERDGVRAKSVGRNEPCHCGSGRKYKNCCRGQDTVTRKEQNKAMLPPWLIDTHGKLQQFEKYVCNVFDLPGLLGSLSDGRREPTYPTFDVVNSLFHAALLRLPSINAIEGDLKDSDFQMLLGLKPQEGVKAFSSEVIDNVLDKLDCNGPRDCIEKVINKAERNKAFRDDTFSTLRCVAIDGWEPFASYDRHCPYCLTREVSVKNHTTGEVVKRTQYYHRYVVAMLVAPLLDLVLGIEPVLNDEARRDLGEDARHEGELTAAHRLIDSLHDTFGNFIDAFVFDALYANGPVMTRLKKYNYGGFIVLKKDANEPLKEALDLWKGKPPCNSFNERERKEHIDFWDVDDIETLDTYRGKVRVIRAVITKANGKSSTWCFALVGKARKTGMRAALKTIRARWHIENTAFNQWVQYWNLSHVFHHTANALLAIVLLWSLVFNLLQLFIYRRLKRRRNPKDPTDTIRHIVEKMLRNLGSIPVPFPWQDLGDTS